MRRWRASDRGPFAASDALADRIEERFQEQGFGLWALEVAGSGEFIGFTGLNPMPAGIPGGGGMEVGWRLARRAWGHGYATEAATKAVDLAFGPLQLPELWSMTAVTNQPSQAVMRRLGMTRHAFFEHPRLPPGHPIRPHVLYHLAGPVTPPPPPPAA